MPVGGPTPQSPSTPDTRRHHIIGQTNSDPPIFGPSTLNPSTVPTLTHSSTPIPSAKPQSRLAYLDWMRGLACVFMFQTHCYDSWLSPEARKGGLFWWSQLGGTLPAPLFLFLAGFSFAYVTNRLRQKGFDANHIARQTILRGAEVLGFGLLFRLMEYALAWGWAPWTDLLRVDVLNMIGLSMILMGIFCRLTGGAISQAQTSAQAEDGRWKRSTWGGLIVGLAISLLTPLLYTTWRPRWLPWPLESYVNGVHTFDKPQAWLFPIFPWAAFAFFGMAAGFVILSDWARARETKVLVGAGVLGAGMIAVFHTLDGSSIQLYPIYDFWHTSPNFFLIRVGILLLVLSFAFAWCRWGWGALGSGGGILNPLLQLGQTSLLVYWVHIEFVYGKFSILPKRAASIPKATFGLCVIFASMLLLSMFRTNWKARAAHA